MKCGSRGWQRSRRRPTQYRGFMFGDLAPHHRGSHRRPKGAVQAHIRGIGQHLYSHVVFIEHRVGEVDRIRDVFADFDGAGIRCGAAVVGKCVVATMHIRRNGGLRQSQLNAIGDHSAVVEGEHAVIHVHIAALEVCAATADHALVIEEAIGHQQELGEHF